MKVLSVVGEVVAERERQDAKWGEQNHPDGTGRSWHQHMARSARQTCEEMFAAGQGTWGHILAEEFFEALAESDPVKLRAELIQVAAVSVAWVGAIDRRTDREPTPVATPTPGLHGCTHTCDYPACQMQGHDCTST